MDRPLLRIAGYAIAWALGVAATGCGAPPDNEPSDTATDTIRVLAYNIHHGEGMDEVVDLERIAALIRSVDPDLVALQEIDSVTARTDGVDQATALGRLTDLHPYFGRFMAYDGGAYGMALLTRWVPDSVSNLRLPDGTEPRASLSAVVTLPSGQPLRLVGVHFYETEPQRLAQAQSLEEQLATTGDRPTVLAGDFNSLPGSPVMSFLAQTWTLVDKGEDRLTFSSFDPFEEIDFTLFRPADRFEVISERVLDEPVASDHRAILVEFVVR